MLLDYSKQKSLNELGAVDLIILGSGAAGLTAALTGCMLGLSTVILETASAFGGTTARSSGTIWIPDNPLMREAGIEDDRKKAETYLQNLIPSNETSAKNWLHFLNLAPLMLSELSTKADITFRPYATAPDYQSNLAGAALGYRPLEPMEFDGRKLGHWFDKLAFPLPGLTVFGGMMITRSEAQRLIWAERHPSALALGARLLMRQLTDRLHYKRGTRLVMGNGLVAKLLHGCLMRGAIVHLKVDVKDLTVDADRVTGVYGSQDGIDFTLMARHAVILAGGGFPASAELKASNLPACSSPETPAAATATGSTIKLALQHGAQLGPSQGTNAMWFPSSLWKTRDGKTTAYPHIALDRAKPGSLIVDQDGQRFANEALSYHDFTQAMLARGEAASPAWLIAGRKFIYRYGLGVVRPRSFSLKSYVTSGYLKHGKDCSHLASQLGIPAEKLTATINRFNDAARQGRDEDFFRGETAYQLSNGDPTRGLPNPCLGAIEATDLYAVALWPTPLATARGLICGSHGEVLNAKGLPIVGLYAAGNDMQSIFEGQYPGAGAQIGPAMTFGWAAAHQAAAQQDFHGREE
jgi:3-oxosteroid 1-dehydrogenase